MFMLPSTHGCLLPHTVITLCSLYAIVVVVCPVLSAAPVIQCVRINDEDVEDLDEDVYCSIAVTKHM